MSDVQEKIIRYFDDQEIDFIEKDNRTWITSGAIADGLNLDRTNINQIYHNNKELLEPYTCVMKFITKGQKRKVRVFDKTGFFGICLRSNSPKALPFQKWVLQVIDEIDKRGYYIDAGRNNLQMIAQLTKRIVSLESKSLGQHLESDINTNNLDTKHAIKMLENVVKFYRENEVPLNLIYYPYPYGVIATKDFIRDYDLYAFQNRVPPLRYLTVLGKLQAKIFRQEIKPKSFYLGTKTKRTYGVIFYVDDLESLFKKNLDGRV